MGGMIGTMRGDRMLRAGQRNGGLDVGFGFKFDSTKIFTHAHADRSLDVKPDGMRLYSVDISALNVKQWDFGVAWDTSTLTAGSTFSMSGVASSPWGLKFKPDGTRFYVNELNNNRVYQYDMSTPWDVASAYSSGLSNAIVTQDRNIDISADGAKLYATQGRDIGQYNMSTPWDITTLTLEKTASNIVPFGDNLDHAHFSSNGMNAYATWSRGSNEGIRLFQLSEAWDVASIIDTGRQIHLAEIDTDIAGAQAVYFREDSDTPEFIVFFPNRIYKVTL
ncbi:lactonase family protein [Phaeobacter inhibens]|uniref:YncE family protein n=1 Tax=Phaeobacter inhibens TaxID=221822 RepID=UPI0021A6A85A|nr:lactonase family protein [Phaeobacter inhibens]UWR77920.1 lactonase family protein [Phaeobacter inhibens]